ncbi:9920_t:CDS:2 [Ambispora gerdemannii]|uniref:9920_t:CDS:1 n=1 Tax=Ambispora gerdemannii TaxID=144530 RepID=A0A9N9CI55_9GLOM|nr:9920_t:CDS:2 [Ambispora gerdemannii]
MNSSKRSKRNQYAQRKFDMFDGFDHVYYRPSKSRGHVFKSIVAAKEAGFIDLINFRLTRCKIERLLQENESTIGLDNLPKLYFERFNRVLVYDGKLSKALKCSMPKLNFEDWGRMIVSLKPQQQTVDAQFETQSQQQLEPQQIEYNEKHGTFNNDNNTCGIDFTSCGEYNTNSMTSIFSPEMPQSSSSPYIDQGSLPYDPNNPTCDEIFKIDQNEASSSSLPARMNEDSGESSNCHITQSSSSQSSVQNRDDTDLKIYSECCCHQSENQIWLHPAISVQNNQTMQNCSHDQDLHPSDSEIADCDYIKENDGRNENVDMFDELTELQQTIIELLLWD